MRKAPPAVSTMIQKNLGNLDRSIRIVAGIGFISLAFIGPHTAWGYIGLIPLITGIVGFCPAYCPLGISSCRVSKHKVANAQTPT